jgi:hypothetical protein
MEAREGGREGGREGKGGGDMRDRKSERDGKKPAANSV